MLQILLLHTHAALVGIRARLGSYHGTKRSMWGKTYCHKWRVWMRWGCTRSKSMFCGGGGGSWYRAGGLRYQRGWWIYWKSLSSRLGFFTNLDDYPEDFRQGEKIKLDKNKVIYIRDEPITHIVDETFDIQKQKVIDPLWEDFIKQELIEVNKRHERVILSNLCGGGNMKFLDMCMDSFLVLASYIPPWQKRSRIKIRISRFIMSEKRLISSILICLVLHRRIG